VPPTHAAPPPKVSEKPIVLPTLMRSHLARRIDYWRSLTNYRPTRPPETDDACREQGALVEIGNPNAEYAEIVSRATMFFMPSIS